MIGIQSFAGFRIIIFTHEAEFSRDVVIEAIVNAVCHRD